jgi:hypothetical protein
MMACDICNASIIPLAGTEFKLDVFRKIVQRGFGPDIGVLMFMKLRGVTDEQWKSNLVETSATPRLLCPSCTSREWEFLPIGLVC